MAKASEGTAHIQNVMNNLWDGEPLKKPHPSRAALARAAQQLRNEGSDGFVIGNDGGLFSDEEAKPKTAVHIDLLHPSDVAKAHPQALAEISLRNSVRIGGKEERKEVESFFDRRAE